MWFLVLTLTSLYLNTPVIYDRALIPAAKSSSNGARRLLSDSEPIENWIVDLTATEKGTILHLPQGSNFFHNPSYV